MAKIYNSDVTKGLAQNAGIQISVDKVPNELAEKIVPTFETNPALLRRIEPKTQARTTSGTTTLYTTPTNQDYYITGAYLGYSKDADCDTATGNFIITTTINGATANILTLPKLTLTADRDSIAVNFRFPIKIDRGVTITHTASFAAGKCSTVAGIYGYLDEKSNA